MKSINSNIDKENKSKSVKFNKIKIIKLIRRFSLIPVLVILLYTSYNSIIGFYQGYHALDLSFNFLNLGYTQDQTLQGNIVTLKESYVSGLSLIKTSFQWLVFDVILSFIFGYLLKTELKGGIA